jgi:hypothetical protein
MDVAYGAVFYIYCYSVDRDGYLGKVCPRRKSTKRNFRIGHNKRG